MYEKEIQALKEQIKGYEQEKAHNSALAWKARTFTERDNYLAKNKEYDILIQNAKWRIEFLEDRIRQEAESAKAKAVVAPAPKKTRKTKATKLTKPVTEEKTSSEPTVDDLLAFFGE